MKLVRFHQTEYHIFKDEVLMKFTYQLKSFALRPLLEPGSKSCITGIAGSGGLMVREGSL